MLHLLHACQYIILTFFAKHQREVKCGAMKMEFSILFWIQMKDTSSLFYSKRGGIMMPQCLILQMFWVTWWGREVWLLWARIIGIIGKLLAALSIHFFRLFLSFFFSEILCTDSRISMRAKRARREWGRGENPRSRLLPRFVLLSRVIEIHTTLQKERKRHWSKGPGFLVVSIPSAVWWCFSSKRMSSEESKICYTNKNR